MNWKQKLLIEKLMSFVPFSYRFLSYIAEKRGRFSYYDSDWIDLGINRCQIIYKNAGFSFEHKNILELGTGRHGSDLLIFYLLGAKNISTFDHISHLNFDKILKNTENVDKYFDKISSIFKIEQAALLDRKSKIKCNNLNTF